MKSLVLLSGGLDSTANLILEKKMGHSVQALFFDYGHKAASAEWAAAQKISAYLDTPIEKIQLPFLASWSASSLNKKGDSIPEFKNIEQLDNLKICKASAQKVWVPNRNGLFINIAACYAEAFRIPFIVVGFNFEEAQTFSDNSKEFVTRVNQSLKMSCMSKTKVICHTIQMNKKEIAQIILRESFPTDMLWSCYAGNEQRCGECESCLRFSRAFGAI